MSTSTDEDVLVIDAIDFEIPCDAANTEDWPDTPGPAKWIGSMRCPHCNAHGTFLFCDDCKDMILNEFTPDTYCGYCGFIAKMSAFFTSLNPI